MADTKQIILDLQIPAIKSVEDLNNALKTTNQSLKTLDVTTEEGAKEFQRLSEQSAKYSNALNDVRKNQKAANDTAAASTKTLDGLRKKLASLTSERNGVEFTSKRFGELQKEIKKVNDEIKETEQAGGDFRRNVGNYGSAITSLVPGLNGVAGGFTAMKTTALAFIATPIGAVIGALGLALGALISYFKGSEEGQTKFNRLMEIGGAIVGKFSELIQKLGKFLFENVVKGFEAAINFLDKFVPGFRAAREELEKYLNLDTAEGISALEERRVLLNRLLITERGRLRAAIEEAKLRAESTKEIKARTEALKEVERLTNELFDKESELAKLERDIAQQQAELAPNTIEDNDKIAESIAKVDDIERQRDAALKENATKLLAVNEQIRASYQKILDERRKQLEAEAKETLDINRQTTESTQQTAEELVNAEIAKNERIKQEDMAFAEFRKNLDREITDSAKKRAEEESDAAYRSAQSQRDAAQAITNSLLSLGVTITDAQIASNRANLERQKEILTEEEYAKALSETQRREQELINQKKVLATTEATINTFLGATNVLTAKPPLPYPLNVAALIATIASGLATVTQINAAAGGGDFVTTGPTMLMVGDNPGGRERVQVTPLSGKGQTRIGHNMVQMAGGGTLTTDPTLRSISRNARNETAALINVVKSLPPPIVTVKDINTVENRVQVNDSSVKL